MNTGKFILRVHALYHSVMRWSQFCMKKVGSVHERRLTMRMPGLQTCLFPSVLLALMLGCKEQEATRDPTPLNVPEPVAGGPYSSPAATSPGSRAAQTGENTEGSNLNQGYFHCPPEGTTPASTSHANRDEKLAPIDCPPGDPNASTAIIGIPEAADNRNEGNRNAAP
jgi:hypothetical protein